MWWEIEDPEERQRAYEEQDIPVCALRDSPEYRLASAANWARVEYAQAKRRRIMAEGKTCAKCGGEIGGAAYRYQPLLQNGYGGTTYRRRPTLDADPICGECAPDWLPELSTRVYTLHMYPHNVQCENCGREVFFVSASERVPAKMRVFCCDDRRTEAKAKRSSARRVEPHTMECEICHTEFSATRSDARTCSPKCRQKAYRQRLRV